MVVVAVLVAKTPYYLKTDPRDLLFGRVKRVSRDSAPRSRVLARLTSLAQIGELARRLDPREQRHQYHRQATALECLTKGTKHGRIADSRTLDKNARFFKHQVRRMKCSAKW